jgi:hypothetical protein
VGLTEGKPVVGVCDGVVVGVKDGKVFVGAGVGSGIGSCVGLDVGASTGNKVGFGIVGCQDCNIVGTSCGEADGNKLGCPDLVRMGTVDGIIIIGAEIEEVDLDGITVGANVGIVVGSDDVDGNVDGRFVGAMVGSGNGWDVGVLVGTSVGVSSVGLIVDPTIGTFDKDPTGEIDCAAEGSSDCNGCQEGRTVGIKEDGDEGGMVGFTVSLAIGNGIGFNVTSTIGTIEIGSNVLGGAGARVGFGIGWSVVGLPSRYSVGLVDGTVLGNMNIGDGFKDGITTTGRSVGSDDGIVDNSLLDGIDDNIIAGGKVEDDGRDIIDGLVVGGILDSAVVGVNDKEEDDSDGVEERINGVGTTLIGADEDEVVVMVGRIVTVVCGSDVMGVSGFRIIVDGNFVVGVTIGIGCCCGMTTGNDVDGLFVFIFSLLDGFWDGMIPIMDGIILGGKMDGVTIDIGGLDGLLLLLLEGDRLGGTMDGVPIEIGGLDGLLLLLLGGDRLGGTMDGVTIEIGGLDGLSLLLLGVDTIDGWFIPMVGLFVLGGCDPKDGILASIGVVMMGLRVIRIGTTLGCIVVVGVTWFQGTNVGRLVIRLGVFVVVGVIGVEIGTMINGSLVSLRVCCGTNVAIGIRFGVNVTIGIRFGVCVVAIGLLMIVGRKVFKDKEGDTDGDFVNVWGARVVLDNVGLIVVGTRVVVDKVGTILFPVVVGVVPSNVLGSVLRTVGTIVFDDSVAIAGGILFVISSGFCDTDVDCGCASSVMVGVMVSSFSVSSSCTEGNIASGDR